MHREAGVPKHPWGFQELEKFHGFLGPQGYQLIVVEPSKCLIVFKEAKYNNTPHVISLVKHQDHFDGLTSIPALSIAPMTVVCAIRVMMGATHHNCGGQNCPACLRTNKTCPNYAAWIKPTFECPNCNCKFYGQDCFKPTKRKERRKTTKAFVKAGENFWNVLPNFILIPPNRISGTM